MAQTEEHGDLKMYIFVLRSLESGKAAVQVGHAVERLTYQAVCDMYEQLPGPPSATTLAYLAWRNHPTKICYGADSDQLVALASENGACCVVDDDWAPGTLTVVAFAPRKQAPSAPETTQWKLLYS